MLRYETDEIIEELFESLLPKHQRGSEERMRGSNIIFDCVDILCYKLHK